MAAGEMSIEVRGRGVGWSGVEKGTAAWKEKIRRSLNDHWQSIYGQFIYSENLYFLPIFANFREKSKN
jgi:hypothetical protein